MVLKFYLASATFSACIGVKVGRCIFRRFRRPISWVKRKIDVEWTLKPTSFRKSSAEIDGFAWILS